MGSRAGPSWIEGPVCPTARTPIRRNPWFRVSRSALAVSNGQSVHPQPEVPGAGEWTGRSCWSPTGFRRQVSTRRPRRPPSDGNGKLKPALLGMPLFPSAWVSRRGSGTDTHQKPPDPPRAVLAPRVGLCASVVPGHHPGGPPVPSPYCRQRSLTVSLVRSGRLPFSKAMIGANTCSLMLRAGRSHASGLLWHYRSRAFEQNSFDLIVLRAPGIWVAARPDLSRFRPAGSGLGRVTVRAAWTMIV